jgi:hypothetical protein
MTGATAHLLFSLPAILQTAPLTPIDTAKHWVSVLTWPVIFMFVVPTTWWLRGYLIEIRELFTANITRLQDTHTLVLNTREAISTIKNNHLAHIEEAILNQKEFQATQLDTLQKIATGIGILVDRGRRVD